MENSNLNKSLINGKIVYFVEITKNKYLVIVKLASRNAAMNSVNLPSLSHINDEPLSITNTLFSWSEHIHPFPDVVTFDTFFYHPLYYHSYFT